MLAGRSPVVGRRIQEDQSNLICSPTESESGSLGGGGFPIGPDNGNLLLEFPQKSPKIGALNQVVQSLRLGGGKSYSDRGSCPNLSQNQSNQNRPLLTRTLLGDESTNSNDDLLTTPYGTVLVAKRGNPKGPALITFHDLGLNHITNFQTFFNSPAMALILGRFAVYHINAPGQERNARDLPPETSYPTMEQLSEIVEFVCHNYGLVHFVGLGVGLGANVLVRLGLRRPKLVDGLILVNCTSSRAGWVEWAYHKMNLKNLKKEKGRCVGESVVDYLLWYHLGTLGGERSIDSVSLASIFKQHFMTEVNPANLALLIQSYVSRSDIKLARELAPNGKQLHGSTRTLKMSVLNMVGDHSPHTEATVNFNGKLDPAMCTWMKIQDAGMVLEEQPDKAGEAIRLFIQGLGYTIKTARSKSLVEESRKLSLNLSAHSTPIRKAVNLNQENLIF